jgi:hypothetical protein
VIGVLSADPLGPAQLVREWLPNGSLSDAVQSGTLTATQKAKIFVGIVLGL